MKLFSKLYPLAWICASLLFSPATAGAGEMMVAAAASLTDALKEIVKAYELKSGDRIIFTFGGSSDLARQIDEGAPVDLFFSADTEKMDILAQKGRIEPASRKDLLSNQLVITVSEDSNLTIGSPRDLLRADIRRIALAEPSTVPAGIYAKKYLEGEKIWDALRRKVVPVLDVRAALASVESGNVDAGFVYRTDAAISKRVKVVFRVPPEKGPKIVYPLAIVKESKNKAAAANFLSHLLSDSAGRTFERYGFIVLNPSSGAGR
jgi:molybdate transport system substrate-binding protein